MEMSSLSSSTSWRVATTVSGMMASSALTWRSASLNLPSVTLRYIPFNRSSSVLSVYGCTGEKILVQAPRCLRLGSAAPVRTYFSTAAKTAASMACYLSAHALR